MKRGLVIVASIFSLAFASAYIRYDQYSNNLYYGGYGRFSPMGLFDSLNIDLIALAMAFLMVFAMCMFSLKKFFKSDRTTAAILSIGISFFVIYGLVRSNFSVGTVFFSLGISENAFYTMLPWIVIGLMILIFLLFGFCALLAITGGVFFAVGFFKLVYQWELSVVLGIIFLILDFFCLKKERTRIGPDMFKDHQWKICPIIFIAGIIIITLGIYGTNTMLIIIGAVLVLIWIFFCLLKKSASPGTSIISPRKTRIRSDSELQNKYDFYSQKIRDIQRKNKGKIPAIGTPDGKLRHRYIQAMKAIENIAKNQGYRLR